MNANGIVDTHLESADYAVFSKALDEGKASNPYGNALTAEDVSKRDANDAANTKSQNVRLTTDDVDSYNSSSSEKVMRKKAKTPDGVLKNDDEIKSYIEKSLTSDNKEIKTYAKVGDGFVNDVKAVTDGDVDISGKYMEIPSDKLRHSQTQHTEAKQMGDLPLTKEDFYKLPDYIDDYDDIVEVVPTKNGTRIKVAKK